MEGHANGAHLAFYVPGPLDAVPPGKKIVAGQWKVLHPLLSKNATAPQHQRTSLIPHLTQILSTIQTDKVVLLLQLNQHDASGQGNKNQK
eukprot:6045568-Ditylum_brightwellii.AAC.1